MKQTAALVIRHPVVLIVYAFYLLLWILQLHATILARSFSATRETGEIYCGQGLVFGFFFNMTITMVYFFVTVTQAIFSQQKRFYGILAILIVLPAVLSILIGS